MGSNDTAARGRFAFPAMITGSACLAFGPWLVRLADVGPLASAFWRQALAVPFLFALAFAGSRRSAFAATTPRLLGLAVLAGAAFAADLSVWHLGILRTSLANATLLANAATFLFPLYGLLFLGNRLTGPQWWALASAALGVTLLLGRSAELSPRHLAGDLLCLAAALFYTVYLVAIEKLRGTLAAMPALALATLASALSLVPLAASGVFWPHDWTPVLALAIGSQVIGQGLIVYAVRHLSPLVVGLCLLVQPSISAFIGAVRFGEVPGMWEITGALLVVAALLIARLPVRAKA
ncbi:MAG: DMT family transporter [Sphingomonadales bacterium]|jgi:drug/metabolite transporter (DMT)-like permease